MLFVDFIVKNSICIDSNFFKSAATFIHMQLVVCWFLDLPYGERIQKV